MKQRMTLFMAILLIGIGLSNAQVSQVTGNVMSEEDGLPVVGASVLVKGTTVGTVTDIDGNLQFLVCRLRQKLSGFFYRFAEPGSGCKPVVNVVLKSDAQALEEVVVVAYGTQSARTVTASVASIRNDVLKDVPNTSLDQMMQGRASGLNVTTPSGGVGQAPVVHIRGVTRLLRVLLLCT